MAKPKENSAPAAASPAKPAARAAVRHSAAKAAKPPAMAATYAAIVKRLEKDYGVKVGATPPRRKNPYQLSPEATEKALRNAGILTRTGKLSSDYK